MTPAGARQPKPSASSTSWVSSTRLRKWGAAGAGSDVCPPEQNTADEVRWAFMRWVHASYTERKEMPAADALLATLKDSFPCGD